MPATAYMMVDARRTTRFGFPGHCEPAVNLPTLAQLPFETGGSRGVETPTELYQDWMQIANGDTQVASEIRRVDQWCNEACDRWYGDSRRSDAHWGLALAAGPQSSMRPS